MSGSKKIVLIHPDANRQGLPGLAEALSRAGAEVDQYFFSGDYESFLDVLMGDVLPVVVKSRQEPDASGVSVSG